MTTYVPPVRDTLFVMRELLRLDRHADLTGFANATPDMVEAIVTEAGRFTAEVLAPLNRSGDRQGCRRDPDGGVRTPDGFREAFALYRDAGWGTLLAPEAFGGQDMPHALAFVLAEYVASANLGFAMYGGVTNGAISALIAKASDQIKQAYVPKLVTLDWLGTMNLTEAHAGTDLGLIRTRAVPQDDGSHAITGEKIFISGGDNDLTANIVHLVLARTPGAPEGSRGISLFVVPKFLIGGDGSLGARNAVHCASIEHKMGIRASATCVMHFEGAKGWLIGEEHKGLAAMFIMMNAARLEVGIQALSQAELAYQNGARYALERRQGRALSGLRDENQRADPLIVHPDVRRMLMEARAFTEGLRALIGWAALLVDLSHKHPDEAERQNADDILGLLTPVVKGWGTDMGFQTAVNMQQIWGGHGYIVESGMEQIVRDARVPMIFEGANGVQAMDLCGRKLALNGGRAIRAWFALLDGEMAAAGDDPVAVRLAEAVGELKAATAWFARNAPADPHNLGAGSYAYMHLMGLVATGLMWLRMSRAADAALAAGEGDAAFYEAKKVTAQFFVERMLPDTAALRRKIEGGAESLMALPPEAFAPA